MGNREGYRWKRRRWEPTDAQRRVLEGIAAGERNAAIAARLGLASETVKWHVGELLAETDCSNRSELGRWWADHQGSLALAA